MQWVLVGETSDVSGLCASIYDRFTEGFDTPDLDEAKALLDELRENGERW